MFRVTVQGIVNILTSVQTNDHTWERTVCADQMLSTAQNRLDNTVNINNTSC